MKFPKRRKLANNPYTISYSENSKKYFVNFKDSQNNIYCTEITKDIFREFNQFELDDISQMNEYDRHIEHSMLTENTLNKRLNNKNLDIEEYVINKIMYQNIYNAILKLPINQSRRIIFYYFYNLKQNEIAKLENCSIRAVQYSLNCALKNLKKLLSKTS